MNRNCQALIGPIARAALVGVAVLTLAACGDRVTRPDRGDVDAGPKSSPEAQVKRRALKRWNLVIDRDFDKAYDLLSPGYRETNPRDIYVKKMTSRPLQWTKVFFQEATCEVDVCQVELQVNAQFQMPVMRVGTVDAVNVIKENWILSDEEWYLVPKADR